MQTEIVGTYRMTIARVEPSPHPRLRHWEQLAAHVGQPERPLRLRKQSIRRADAEQQKVRGGDQLPDSNARTARRIEFMSPIVLDACRRGLDLGQIIVGAKSLRRQMAFDLQPQSN